VVKLRAAAGVEAGRGAPCWSTASATTGQRSKWERNPRGSICSRARGPAQPSGGRVLPAVQRGLRGRAVDEGPVVDPLCKL
jgi:hypothetical protein